MYIEKGNMSCFILIAIVCLIIYNVFVSIFFLYIRYDFDKYRFNSKIEYNSLATILIGIFMFIPIIGCFFICNIIASKSTGTCDVCDKTVYFDAKFCKQCKTTYDINDKHDLRLAKEKYRLLSKARKQAIDEQIKGLEEIYKEGDIL
jgi:hypothetical protein